MSKYLIRYVDDCFVKTRIFKSEKALDNFIKKISKYLQEKGGPLDGFWIDLVVRDISGKIEEYE